MTSWPSSRRRSHRCEPRKPAPPVTSISLRSIMAPPAQSRLSEAMGAQSCDRRPRQLANRVADLEAPPASESGPVLRHPVDELRDPGGCIDLRPPAQHRLQLAD